MATPSAPTRRSLLGRSRCGVGVQNVADREQAAPVPVDDGGEELDRAQRPHPDVVEHGDRGVAQTEAADHDIDSAATRHGGEAEAGERDLRRVEPTRHEVLVVELHLEDVAADLGHAPSPKADLADWRRLRVELFEHRRRGQRRPTIDPPSQVMVSPTV